MRSLFALNFFLLLAVFQVSLSSLASEQVYQKKTFKEVAKEDIDLNGDQKKDSIFWLKETGQFESEELGPTRLLIALAPLKSSSVILDLKDSFCEIGNSSDPNCVNINIRSDKTKAGDPIIEIQNFFDAASAVSRKTIYKFRFKSGVFSLIGATAERFENAENEVCKKHSQKQPCQLLEVEKIDINYINKNIERRTWLDSSLTGSKKINLKSLKCKLKKPDQQLILKDFKPFSLEEEIDCK